MDGSHSVGGVNILVTRETYTFSRALHLMRYGGKKMRCLDWSGYSEYLCVVGNSLIGYESDGKRWDLNDLSLGQDQITDMFLCGSFIMGSWVEVK